MAGTADGPGFGVANDFFVACADFLIHVISWKRHMNGVAMDYVIGIDIGTQSTKALLVDRQGGVIAQHASSYRPDTPRPLWAEQWPSVWFNAVVECIARCVAQAKEQGIAASTTLRGAAGPPKRSTCWAFLQR